MFENVIFFSSKEKYVWGHSKSTLSILIENLIFIKKIETENYSNLIIYVFSVEFGRPQMIALGIIEL